MARKRSVGGAEVRAWAQSAGVEVGQRGRFSAELVEAFHKANPKVRYETGHVPVREIKGIRISASGRKVPVTVKASVPEVRAFAAEAGLSVGQRGRLSSEVYAAFAARPKA